MSKFRIVKTEYQDGDLEFRIEMNTSFDNYVTISSRNSLEEARKVRDFLNGRNILSQEVVG